MLAAFKRAWALTDRHLIQRADQFYWGSGLAADVPALTYYLMLSLVPLALGLTGLAAVLLGNYHAAQEAAQRLADHLPVEVRKDVVRLIVDTNRDSPRLIVLGVGAMTWTCAGAINVLERSLSRLLDRERLGVAARLGRQLAFSAGVAFLLLGAAVISSVAGGLVQVLPDAHWLASSWTPGVTAASVLVICTGLMRFLPRGGMHWRCALMGALPATLCLLAIPQAIAAFARASDLQAARVFLMLAVVMFGCYLVAQSLLIGAGLAAQAELRLRSGTRVRLPQVAAPGRGQQRRPRAAYAPAEGTRPDSCADRPQDPASQERTADPEREYRRGG